ncbi:MAG: DUF427 domain-containing protein [Nocardioidaceae bacterium]
MRRPTPDQPGPGQESVWDYPRPPRLERTDHVVEVTLGGVVIASTSAPLRVLETSHPPTYYLPFTDFVAGSLRPAEGGSMCEWKGQASYLDLVGGSTVAPRAGWFYPSPTPAFATIVDHLALYPGMMDRCTVDGEVVLPQPGGFYGGWVTSKVVGPFKGDPGTMFW